MFESFIKKYGKPVCSIIITESKERIPDLNTINLKLIDLGHKPLDHSEIISIIDEFMESDLSYDDLIITSKKPKPVSSITLSNLPDTNSKLTSRNTPLCLCGSKNLKESTKQLLGGIVYYKCLDCTRLVS